MQNTFTDAEAQIEAQEKRVREETEKLLALHRARPAREVRDYELQTAEGPRKLSSFFNGKNEMLLIHNMGKRCSYCTLWADGLNGFTPHLLNRAGLVVVNDDPLETQKQMSAERGWTFPMASSRGTSLFEDFGMKSLGSEEAGDWPGVSVLTRDADGTICQKSKAMFGPGDLYCSIWNFFGMLDENVKWEPKQKYFKAGEAAHV
jgi:predicted dithiol-disulfide oxidoreductase (DUF899 family)